MKRSLLYFLFFSLSIVSFAQQGVITNVGAYVCPPCGSDCDKISHDHPSVCEHCNMVLVKKDQMKTIAFYLQDGVEVLDFAGPMEVFVYAGYKVFTVSNQEQIKSQGILKVTPDYTLSNAPQADILAFFGGNSTAAYKNIDVIKWVKKQENIQYHFSVCTGAFVLAEAGILNDKTATTFHDALDNLEENYPQIDVRKDVRFVDNGKVITTAGVSAGIDGALHLVAKLQGLNAARRTAYYMEYDNWKPGDGLILSDDNPYIDQVPVEELEEFSGRYQFKNNTTVEIKVDSENRHLTAQVSGMIYPVYYESKDTFSDVGSEPIFFQRNEKEEIIGYKLNRDGSLYKKIK